MQLQNATLTADAVALPAAAQLALQPARAQARRHCLAGPKCHSGAPAIAVLAGALRAPQLGLAWAPMPVQVQVQVPWQVGRLPALNLWLTGRVLQRFVWRLQPQLPGQQQLRPHHLQQSAEFFFPSRA